VSEQRLEQLVRREAAELDRRVQRYRGARPLPVLRERSVVLVDDGVATGSTAAAALTALRGHDPRRLLLAVPVCAARSVPRLQQIADLVLCVLRPQNLTAIGAWYRDFTQTTDEEVLRLLAASAAARP
jgi:putative phosphoribosyl transferase